MASVCIRMDDATKFGFDKFCKEIGISVSSLFNMFAKKVVREQRVPFTMKVDPFYSEENMEFLRKVIEDDKKGIGLVEMSLEELEEKYKKKFGRSL